MRWPSLERPIKTPKQLLVEGRTPEIFFRELIEALGLKNQVEVRSYNSLAELTAFLRVFTGYKEFHDVVSLGVIRDAENNAPALSFQSVCGSLRAVNLACPNGLAEFTSSTPRTGVFILPDCQGIGMLESLCWEALAEELTFAPHLRCVEGYVNCLQQFNIPLQNSAKTKVWTYLAAQGKFDPQVGRAAQAKVWNFQGQTFSKLAAFLTAL